MKGTDAGHCPRCGFVPPSAPIARDPTFAVGPGVLIAIVVALGIFVGLAVR